jgi:methanol corrinoid protein
MSYEELENKIGSTFLAVRYNVEIEGAAIKPEE